MKNALVVGGTGMLSNVSLWLGRKGYRVYVIGRNSEKMNRLIKKSPSKSLITPILVDYRNEAELRENLNSFKKKNGEIDLVVAWIHSIAENALDLIIKEFSNSNNHKWILFHILGSNANLEEIKNNINILEDCQYHQIQLGYIRENGYSRWLTNEEISNGVIDSIINEKLINIIGLTGPEEQWP